MSLTTYPRIQYADIDGVMEKRIIQGPEEEEPEVWVESPHLVYEQRAAKRLALMPVQTEEPGELAAALEEALEEKNATLAEPEVFQEVAIFTTVAADDPDDEDGPDDTDLGDVLHALDARDKADFDNAMTDARMTAGALPDTSAGGLGPAPIPDMTFDDLLTRRLPLIGGTPESRKAAKKARKAAQAAKDAGASAPAEPAA